MKKRILIPSLIVGALLTGSLALAVPGNYGRGNCDGRGKGAGAMTAEQHETRMGQKLEMMKTVLDLSAEQQTQIEALLNQQYQDTKALREQMQSSREEMHSARTADTFSETDFRAKAAKKAELKIEMMVAHTKLKQQLYALLTPEQQEKADTLGGLMGDHGKGRHGGHGYGN